jgi:hypothetical protein
MNKVNLRKAQLCLRYGNVKDRTVDRMVETFRIPKPDYYGNRIPFWREEKLDRNDRALSAQPRHIREQFARLLEEVAAAATGAEARAILHVARASGKLDGLTEAQAEGLQDAVTEKS